MTKTIMILAIVAAFVVGSIMTGTMASAAPPNDNPGQPFVKILEQLSLILQQAMDLDDNITMIQSDVTDIKTETDKIQMIKDTISSNVIPEPLNQLKIMAIAGSSPINTVDIVSTGPMIVDVCIRVTTGISGVGDGFVIVRNEIIDSSPEFNASITIFASSFSSGVGTQCVTMVAEPSQTISVIALEQGDGQVSGYINMHTTTSATLTITDLTT